MGRQPLTDQKQTNKISKAALDQILKNIDSRELSTMSLEQCKDIMRSSFEEKSLEK